MELNEFDAWTEELATEHDAALDRPVREWIWASVIAAGSVLMIVAGALLTYAHLKGKL